jgi:hypothetical protein
MVAALAQVGCHAGRARTAMQLRRKALHASVRRSSLQPGSASQPTGFRFAAQETGADAGGVGAAAGAAGACAADDAAGVGGQRQGAAGGCGKLAHPLSIEAARAPVAHRVRQFCPTSAFFGNRSSAMWWLALEIALGLALFILLVWWTLPRRSRPADQQREGKRS